MLKSLVDWEKNQREADRVNEGKQSSGEGLNREPNDIRSREDLPTDFEKLKAHKSTIEAAISEVSVFLMQNLDFTSSDLFIFFVYFY